MEIVEGEGTRDERVARAQQIVEAVELAAARQDHYVWVPAMGRPIIGPLSRQDAFMYRDEALDAGRKPIVLQAVEVYE